MLRGGQEGKGNQIEQFHTPTGTRSGKEERDEGKERKTTDED